jgi:hypothetical protein
VTMSRTIEKRPQDEHVKGSLEDSHPLLRLFCHRRHPTLDLATMVDIRLSGCQGVHGSPRNYRIIRIVRSCRQAPVYAQGFFER